MAIKFVSDCCGADIAQIEEEYDLPFFSDFCSVCNMICEPVTKDYYYNTLDRSIEDPNQLKLFKDEDNY